MSLRALRSIRRLGLTQWLKNFARFDDAKAGTLVGTDRRGNEYYECTDGREMQPRTRWVVYKEYNHPDASHVAPEWDTWLKKSKQHPPPPPQIEGRPHKALMGNTTGTDKAFVTYDTTVQKVQPWLPRCATTPDRADVRR